MKLGPLTFEQLAEANNNRLVENYPGELNWNPANWCLAAVGSLGYASYLLARRLALNDVNDSEIYEEIADTIIYLDHFCTCLGGTLGVVVARKFKSTSQDLSSIENLPCLDAPDE